MTRIVAPKSWKNPENHIEVLLNDSWYRILCNIYKSIFEATHQFYQTENIFPMMFPVTTGSISSPMGLGSDSVPVSVNIRGKKVYLADSMQFSLEVGTRLSGHGAYYIMPTFRGEQTDERHLNEFIHSEVEIPGTIDNVMDLAERYIKYMIQYLLTHNTDDISLVAGDAEHLRAVLKRGFVRLSYDSAIEILKAVPNSMTQISDSLYNITKVGEQYLLKEYGDFIWLTDLPWLLVPFYQAHGRSNEAAIAADLLAGIGEILGCGQRVKTVADLNESLAAHNVDASEYLWYKRMREISPLQTSGFGLGIERFILWILKHDDIRDCALLLRDHDNISMP